MFPGEEEGKRLPAQSQAYLALSHCFLHPAGSHLARLEQELRRMHGRRMGRMNQSLHNSVIITNTQPGANPMDT